MEGIWISALDKLGALEDLGPWFESEGQEYIDRFVNPAFVSYKGEIKSVFKKKITEIVDLNKIRQDSRVIDGVNFLDNDFNKIKYCLTETEKIRYIELGRISTRCMTNT